MSIETIGLTKHYDDTKAVDGVSLSLGDEVRCLALIGPSGGGKSTLLRLLGGLERPTSGTVSFDGVAYPDDEEGLREVRKKRGFLFQSFNLFPHFDARDNIVLPLVEVHGWTRDRAIARADETLDRFRLRHHATKTPAQLSGGQQQRVALARAIAHEPEWLLLDEPTSALDPEMKAEVLDLVDELREAGQRIVLSTHEMGFARQSSDHVVFLAEGKCVEEGAAETVFGNPKEEALKAFLAKVMKW